MPQPLSSVNRNASVLFHPKAMSERPELAALVARAIAGWSEIEGQMGSLLVRMLGADAEPALAMYSSLTSAPAQIASVRAAAGVVLDGDAKEMLDAVLNIAGARSSQRHHLAHRVWGYSESVPDALILADGKDIAKHWMHVASAVDQISQGKIPAQLDWDRRKLKVYKKADLDAIIAQMDELHDYFYQLSFLMQPRFPWPDRIFDYLNSKPPIQTELTRIRKAQQNC